MQRVSVVFDTSYIVHSWEVSNPPSSELTAIVQQPFSGSTFWQAGSLKFLASCKGFGSIWTLSILDSAVLKSKPGMIRAAGTCKISRFKTVALVYMSAVLDVS